MSTLTGLFGLGGGGGGGGSSGTSPSLVAVFQTSGSFIARRTTQYRITGVGPGGSGGAAAGINTTPAKATGGGPGAFLKDVFTIEKGTVVTVTIGAPGTNAVANATTAAVATNGVDAGNTTIQIGSSLTITLGGGKGGRASVDSMEVLSGGASGVVAGVTTSTNGAGSAGGDIISTGWTSGLYAAATGGGAPDALSLGGASTRMLVGRVIINGAVQGVGITGGGSPGGGSPDIFLANTNTVQASGSGGTGGPGDLAGPGGPDMFGGTGTPPALPVFMQSVDAQPFSLFGAGGAAVVSTTPPTTMANSPGSATGAWGQIPNLASVSMGSNYGSGPFAAMGGHAMSNANGGTSTIITAPSSPTSTTAIGYGAGSPGVAARRGNASGTVTTTSRVGGASIVVIEEM